MKDKNAFIYQKETGRQYNILQISEKEENTELFSVFTGNGVENDGLKLQ